jgi:hypothetical protein
MFNLIVEGPSFENCHVRCKLSCWQNITLCKLSYLCNSFYSFLILLCRDHDVLSPFIMTQICEFWFDYIQ